MLVIRHCLSAVSVQPAGKVIAEDAKPQQVSTQNCIIQRLQPPAAAATAAAGCGLASACINYCCASQQLRRFQ